jgi:hypothetical protein
MTPLNKVKRAMATAMGALLVVMAGATLAGLTTVVISYGTGANPATAFTPAAEPLSARSETVSWNPSEPDLLRSIERQTRVDVAKAWVGAVSGEADDIWFSGGALERKEDAAQLGVDADTTWIGHQITAYFYSLDGQVLGLEIASTGVVDIGEGDELPVGGSYEVVLILRDGNWRVERLTRL